nr:hypothetical protein [Tanacetum cinerariifolium]
ALEQQQAHQLELEFGLPEVGCFRYSVLPYPLSPRVPVPPLWERRKRRRNRWSIIRNTTSGGDCFQITPRVMVLLGSDPEPEVEAVSFWKKN